VCVIVPGTAVDALDATTGGLLWEYKRKLTNLGQGASARTKTLAIYEDVVLYTAPDSYVVGLDARAGEQRWPTKAEDRGHSSGPWQSRQSGDGGNVLQRSTSELLHLPIWCPYGKGSLALLHDIRRRRPESRHLGRRAGREADGIDLGPAGTYDPIKKILYWGVANPTPNSRMARHGGKWDAIPTDGAMRGETLRWRRNSKTRFRRATMPYVFALPGKWRS
jgi:alcohol dehydrogenase (cytochrome c)